MNQTGIIHKKSFINNKLNVICLAACQHKEVANDTYINKQHQGAFMYFLLLNLRKNRLLPANILIENIRRDLKTHGYNQTPYLGGNPDKLNKPIF